MQPPQPRRRPGARLGSAAATTVMPGVEQLRRRVMRHSAQARRAPREPRGAAGPAAVGWLGRLPSFQAPKASTQGQRSRKAAEGGEQLRAAGSTHGPSGSPRRAGARTRRAASKPAARPCRAGVELRGLRERGVPRRDHAHRPDAGHEQRIGQRLEVLVGDPERSPNRAPERRPRRTRTRSRRPPTRDAPRRLYRFEVQRSCTSTRTGPGSLHRVGVGGARESMSLP